MDQAFIIRLPQSSSSGNALVQLPTVPASQCGTQQCAICLDDVQPEDQLVQLPCGHAFHCICAARWLKPSGQNSGSRSQCCPLCCRKVMATAEGGITTEVK